MGYIHALESAGATVHADKFIGSYQGKWAARVSYQGEDGWIIDYYGSCSGCDAFESWYSDMSYRMDGTYNPGKPSKEDYAAFAADYLADIHTQEQAEARFAPPEDDRYYDSEDREMYDFIRANAP